MHRTSGIPTALSCPSCDSRLSIPGYRRYRACNARSTSLERLLNERGSTGTANNRRRSISYFSRRSCGCAASATSDTSQLLLLNQCTIRHAQSDVELKACAKLRAETFYTYPPERAFAGQIHQIMKMKEEFEALKQQQDTRKAKEPEERSASLMAACPSTCLQGQPASASGLEEIDSELLLGTLDLYAVRAMPGEVLIGECSAPAYLANVCVAKAAHRQGIGKQLIENARRLADEWGCEALFVHILWVNTRARQFYESRGFYIDMEESANTAHYRGHCLEGIEGRGRTILLRYDLVERKLKPVQHRII